MWTKSDIKKFLRAEGFKVLSFEPHLGAISTSADEGEGYKYIFAGIMTTGGPGSGVNSDFSILNISSVDNVTTNTSATNYYPFCVVNYVTDAGAEMIGYKIKIYVAP